jgi:hypothetical protein
MDKPEANAESPAPNTKDRAWKALYITGGIAALLAVFVFRRNLGAELGLLSSFGVLPGVPAASPGSAAAWFDLLQNSPLVGLTFLNFFDVVEYTLLGLVFLAVYVALRDSRKSAMLIAIACGLSGITVALASNQAFAMLALSRQYAAATDDVQRSIFQAAGEALLAANNPNAIDQGTGALVSYLLVLIAGLIISIVMLRSDIFSKATAVVGILANGIALFYFIGVAFAWELYWLPTPISAPFRVVWYFLIALRLFKLAKA